MPLDTNEWEVVDEPAKGHSDDDFELVGEDFQVSPKDPGSAQMGPLDSIAAIAGIPGRKIGELLMGGSGVSPGSRPWETFGQSNQPEPPPIDPEKSIFGISPESIPNLPQGLTGAVPAALGTSLLRTGAGLGKYLTSPQGISEATAAVVAAPAVAAKWAIDMTHGLSESVPAAWDAVKKGDYQGALDNLVQSGALAAGLGHMAKSAISEVRPSSNKPVTETPQTKGESNALPVQKSVEKVLRNAEQGSGEGVELQRMGEGNAKPQEPAAAQEAVPPEATVPVTESGMDVARRVSEMTPEEFVANNKSFNKTNLAIGEEATAADVVELEAMRDKAKANMVEAQKQAEAASDKWRKYRDSEGADPAVTGQLRAEAEFAMKNMANLTSQPQFFNEAANVAKARISKETGLPYYSAEDFSKFQELADKRRNAPDINSKLGFSKEIETLKNKYDGEMPAQLEASKPKQYAPGIEDSERELHRNMDKSREVAQKEWPPVYEKIKKDTGASASELGQLLVYEDLNHPSEYQNLAKDLARNAPNGRLGNLYNFLAKEGKTGKFVWAGTADNPQLGFSPDTPGGRPDPVAARRALEVVNKVRKSIGAEPLPDFFGGESKSSESPTLQLEQPKWTSATSEPISIGAGIKRAMGKGRAAESGAVNIQPLKDLYDATAPKVKEAAEYVNNLQKEALNLEKATPSRKSVLNWSGKLQKSFSEAAQAQKDIRTRVPDKVRREGITNWIQAGGDANVLRQRATQSTNPKLRAGYEAALNLTPEEIGVARDVKQAFDALGTRGEVNDVISNFRENYAPQIWDLGKNRAPMGSARTLKDRFKFSKARTFDSFFEGEQAGFSPKTKDISDLLPVYLHEMNNVIAARQLVSELADNVAKDGRPLVAPRGAGHVVENAAGEPKATLINPRVGDVDTMDYKVMEGQPALSGWRWMSKDSAGNPVMLKGDLAVHPEVYSRMKAALGKSAIREWYDAPPVSQGAALPKAIVKLLDKSNSEAKRTMLGFFAPFHQVQEGTHAVGHRVNPFRAKEGGLIDKATGGLLPGTLKMPKIDLVGNKAQADAARNGLMLLPDRASANQFMEGFRHSGLVSKIPGIGKLADAYSSYLFSEYIPGLKYLTYDAILGRNRKVYADDLASGKVTESDVKVLSAEQANAAYGHLNYADIGRDPTIQHIAQTFALAPDFLEARARFTGQSIKGLTGAKVGREQLLALGSLAVAQAVGAWIAAKTTGGEWDGKRPFEFRKGDRTYTLRSVPEDIMRLAADPLAFGHARLSLIGKASLQYPTGVNWRGQKVTPLETTKELATYPIPLTVKSFLGIGNTPLTEWEQLAGSAGLKISAYSPQTDVYKLVSDWKKNSKNPKLVAEYERDSHTTNPESDYKPLREALMNDDDSQALKEYKKLLVTKSPTVINSAFEHPRPFTGSLANDRRFFQSLNDEDKALFIRARDERKETLAKFRKLKKN